MLSLKQFRNKYKLTLKALAAEIGVTPTTLSKYEKGEWFINQYVIDYIEKNYGEQIKPIRHKPMKKKKIWMPKDAKSSVVKEPTGVENVGSEEPTKAESAVNQELIGTERDLAEVVEVEAEATALGMEKNDESTAKESPADESLTDESSADERTDDESNDDDRNLLEVFIQSQSGATISVQEVVKMVQGVVPSVDHIYIKPAENRAYWTAGTHTGSTLLW